VRPYLAARAWRAVPKPEDAGMDAGATGAPVPEKFIIFDYALAAVKGIIKKII
jgi:hypothetical protein